MPAREAKARYDQLFDEYGQTKDSWRQGAWSMRNEFVREAAVAQPRPPTRFRWHFMEPVSFRYGATIFRATAPDVEVVLQP